jgi:acyl dehydratase
MIDRRRARDYRFAEHAVTVTREALVAFADAIGQADPVYRQADAARAAGHPDLPVPPTYFYCLEMAAPDSASHLEAIGVDVRRVVHGEQGFVFHGLAHAGDTIAVEPRIVDVRAAGGGALEIVTRRTAFERAGELVAEGTTTLVVRGVGGDA